MVQIARLEAFELTTPGIRSLAYDVSKDDFTYKIELLCQLSKPCFVREVSSNHNQFHIILSKLLTIFQLYLVCIMISDLCHNKGTTSKTIPISLAGVAHCPPYYNTSSDKSGSALGGYDIVLEPLSLYQSKKMATALTKLIVLIKGGGEVIASLPRFIEAPHNDKNKCYEGTERRQKLLKLRFLCYHKGTEKNYGNTKLTVASVFPNQMTIYPTMP